MDDRKLSELFQAAVRDVPPASFDESDVALASKRVTARRRSMLVGGSLTVVVAIAVGLVVGSGILGHNLGGSNASAGSAAAAGSSGSTFGSNAVPRRPSGGAQDQQVPPEHGTAGFPTATPMQGGGGVGGVGPGAGSTPSGCGPTDRELAVALANELASVGAPAVVPGLTCQPGVRSAGYQVQDGTADGVIAVIVTNAGQKSPTIGTLGAARATAPASGGRTVTVLSVPAAGSPSAPLSGAIFGMAEDIAGKI